MRKGFRTIIAGCALALASHAMGIMESEQGEPLDANKTCLGHLHTLVAYLRETARLEGKMLVVEWHRDGSVILRCADFTQHMWCQDQELHIEFGDALSEMPER